MRVLHVETGRHLYGGAQQVVYLLRHLQAAGVENVLACSPGSAIADAAAPYVDAIRWLDNGLSAPRSLARMLRVTRPDLLHVHSRRLGVDGWGGRVARRQGIAAIVSRRVDNPEARWLVRHKYRPYARVIAISEGIRQVLLAEGLPADKVVTVRSAVDVQACTHDCDLAAFRRTFGLSTPGPTLGVIAQLIERKGHRHLLAVLGALERDWPDLNVLFFGQGPLREALQQQIAQAGLRSVKLVGFRDDLLRWLGCLDVVVHPADREGLGVSLLQAAAARVPIIATRAGGMPEIVHDGDNGYLIDPGDTAALERSLRCLLEDAELRQRMGQRGREIVEQAFSTEVMARGNLAVYREVVGQ